MRSIEHSRVWKRAAEDMTHYAKSLTPGGNVRQVEIIVSLSMLASYIAMQYAKEALDSDLQEIREANLDQLVREETMDLELKDDD